MPFRRSLAGSCLLALIVLYGPLLRAVHDLLVAAQPVEPVEYVVLMLGGEAHLTMAVDLLRSNRAAEVIIIDGHPGYATRAGATPPLSQVLRSELVRGGIRQEAIVVIASQARSDLQRIESLEQWLRRHATADQQAAILCPRQSSRYYRWLIDAAVAPQRRTSLLVWSPPTEAYDPQRWWRSRMGIKKVMSGYFRLAFFALQGEGQVDQQDWDPDVYEQWLKQRLQGDADSIVTATWCDGFACC